MSWRLVLASVVWLTVVSTIAPYLWSPPGSKRYDDHPVTVIVDHRVVNTYP